MGSIIGQEEESSDEVLAAQDSILGMVSKQVCPEDALKLEKQITEDECWWGRLFPQWEREKSPRWDGLTVEFFLEFWPDLKLSIVKIVQQAFGNGILDSEIKLGLVRLLPKQACCTLMKHWRPITMMPVLYKILAKVIAQRLAK